MTEAASALVSSLGTSFTQMEAVVVIAIGAGAFVTTTVAATIILQRQSASSSVADDEAWVQVDLIEKGLGDGLDDDVEVYQAKRGAGWREYGGEEQEKVAFESGLLAPLVIHDELAAHSVDYPETRTPLSPERLFPTPPRWHEPSQIPDVPSPQRSPALVPAVPLLIDGSGDVIEHVPTGLETNITSVVEDRTFEAPSIGIISWPAISLAPVEEPISPSDTVTPTQETTFGLQLELIPPTPPSLEPLLLPSIISPIDIKSPVVREFVRPVIDIKSPIDSTNPFRSPSAQSSPEDDLLPPPPVYTRYDTVKSPIDPKFVETLLSPLAPSVTTVNVFIFDETILAARIPLPLSIPPTPRVLTVKTEIVEDVFLVDDKKDLSDLDILDSIQPLMTHDSPCIPGSPLSDVDSELSFSSDDSSAPSTPIELKQQLHVTEPEDDPAVEYTPPSPTIDSDDDIRIGEVMDIPDDIDEPPASDPPEPTFALVPFLPGSFDHPSTVFRPAQTSAAVSLMTEDVFQLCKAILAVSNCAGLVAQFVVGFSMWWSLMLVPV